MVCSANTKHHIHVSFNCIFALMYCCTTSNANPYVVTSNRHDFYPCTTKQQDVHNKDHVQLICRPKESALFGHYLPVININNNDSSIRLSSIVIQGNGRIRTCAKNTFSNASDKTTSQLTSVFIEGVQLMHIEKGCFQGLENIATFVLINDHTIYTNTPASQLKQSTVQLLDELQHFKRLKQVHLENVLLDNAANTFGHRPWFYAVESLKLVRNGIGHLDDDAFGRHNRLEALGLEQQQTDGWNLIKNAPKWAANLGRLKSFSLEGTQMAFDQIKLFDLGKTVNSHLEALNLQNCGLTTIVGNNNNNNNAGIGLNLSLLAPHIRNLKIGHNLFEEGQLDGLQQFRQLVTLNLNANQYPLHRLQQLSKHLDKLHVSSTKLVKLTSYAFHKTLKMLDLSENPLEIVEPTWIAMKNSLEELHLNSIRLVMLRSSGNYNGKVDDQSDAFQGWSNLINPLKSNLKHLSLINCHLNSNMFSTWKANATFESRTTLHFDLSLIGNLIKLRSLIMTANYLEYIPHNVFNNLNQLDNLVVANNQLTSVSQSIETNTHQLTTRHQLRRLDLSYNKLTTLPRCAPSLGFATPLELLLPQQPIWMAGEWLANESTPDYNDKIWLGGLHLVGNPFVCDCRLAWLRKWIDRMTEQIRLKYNNATPWGYRIYLDQALNFECKGSNQLTQYKFLNISPDSLWLIQHEDCSSHVNNPDLSVPCIANSQQLDVGVQNKTTDNLTYYLPSSMNTMHSKTVSMIVLFAVLCIIVLIICLSVKIYDAVCSNACNQSLVTQPFNHSFKRCNHGCLCVWTQKVSTCTCCQESRPQANNIHHTSSNSSNPSKRPNKYQTNNKQPSSKSAKQHKDENEANSHPGRNNKAAELLSTGTFQSSSKVGQKSNGPVPPKLVRFTDALASDTFYDSNLHGMNNEQAYLLHHPTSKSSNPTLNKCNNTKRLSNRPKGHRKKGSRTMRDCLHFNCARRVRQQAGVVDSNHRPADRTNDPFVTMNHQGPKLPKPYYMIDMCETNDGTTSSHIDKSNTSIVDMNFANYLPIIMYNNESLESINSTWSPTCISQPSVALSQPNATGKSAPSPKLADCQRRLEQKKPSTHKNKYDFLSCQKLPPPPPWPPVMSATNETTLSTMKAECDATNTTRLVDQTWIVDNESLALPPPPPPPPMHALRSTTGWSTLLTSNTLSKHQHPQTKYFNNDN